MSWLLALAQAWQRLWFTPAAPHTLALLRMFNGGMLFYTHLTWGKNLLEFLGPHAWIDRHTAALLNTPPGQTNFTWSLFYWFDSPALLWTVHVLALAVFAAYAVGWQTRVTSVLSWLLATSYCHRLVGTQFGLDQINVFMAMYIMLGRSGDVYSLDAWLRPDATSVPITSVATNIAIRLLQCHMCVIYLFGGVSKLRGELWWDGSALWFAFANSEYRSLNMTWMIHFPWLIALLTHATVFWETFYCVLVWPRITRPIMIGMAILVHGGIALTLGMITFGTAMIFGNFAFLPPDLVEHWFARWTQREPSRAPSPI